MKQPVPKVTKADVARIAERDFKSGDVESVLRLLSELTPKCGPHDPSRVQLAVLKLDGGNPDWLLAEIATASQDPRDVIAGAECPQYMKRIGSGLSGVNIRQEVIASDWKQYVTWLEREPA
jgi:hypothetical protein